MGTPAAVTFISSGRIALSRACRHACAYCGFRTADEAYLLPPDEIELMLDRLQTAGAIEVIFTAGEACYEFPGVQISLAKNGFTGFTDYIEKICGLANARNLLPVLDIGRLSPIEIRQLSGHVSSIFIDTACLPFQGKGEPHENSRGRDPHSARQAIEEAHQAEIPYHLRILIGIGETADIRGTFISDLARYCAVDPLLQDIRLQVFQPATGTRMQARPPLSFEDVGKTLLALRDAFPVHHISVSPHLFYRFSELVTYGLNDLGSLPVAGGDPVFPTFPVPGIENIKNRLLKENHFLGERLPLTTPIAMRKAHIASALTASRAKLMERTASSLTLIDDKHCFVCGNLNPEGLGIKFAYGEGPSCNTTWVASPKYQGYAGIVHGGIISMLLDEVMAQALIFGGHRIVTIDMKISFRNPAPVGVPLTITGRRTGGKRRLHLTSGEIRSHDGKLFAEAEGRYSAC
ncbi:MAG: radical SAM protein [Candidatus Riflebacteria bacterium]|nr:radical SAM protein [Candidatus Riflebacteria bacterium]